MRRSLIAGAALMLALLGSAAARAEPLTGPTGPYAVVMEADPTLPDHTIYRPADLKAVKGKLPIVAFGNGGCANIGSAYRDFLGEIASRGYLVTAPGPIDLKPAPRQPGAPMVQSKPQQMITALDWAAAEDKRAGSAYRGKLDLGHVAVAGHSCGGLEAIAAGKDPRVTTVVVMNSGIIRGGIPNPDGTTRQVSGVLPATEADLPGLHTPVLYIIGGEKDQAWRGAEGDFKDIQKVPVFNANLGVGHVGTWREPHGGTMGVAALAWLDWKLRGDKTAAKTFTGKDCGLCKDTNWTVKTKNWAD